MYAWGRGKEGQLGLGDDARRGMGVVPTPTRVRGLLDGEIITQVSCGDMHSLALSVGGQVFMWGLLHETRYGASDGAMDHASVSLAGLAPTTMHDAHAAGLMGRLVRAAESVYEALPTTMQTDKIQTVRGLSYAYSLRSYRMLTIMAILAIMGQ